MRKHITILLILLISVILATFAKSNQVIKQRNENRILKERWKWASNKSSEFKDGFWVGYSIVQLMSENSFIGCAGFSKKPSLRTIIKEAIRFNDVEIKSPTMQKKYTHMKSARDVDKILKEIAFLFFFEENPLNLKEIAKIKVSNLELPINLSDYPLIWLGVTEQYESVDFLKDTFYKVNKAEVKNDMITAIAIHEDCEQVMEFLTNVVQSRLSDQLRENATFWIGQQQSKEALEFLIKTVHTDRSDDVKEKAVFSISQIELEAAVDALVELAQDAKSEKVREEAIFWLGQKDDEKSLSVLKKIILNESSQELKKKAIFAISQMQTDDALDVLIDLAKHCKDREIRKNAIFWLGQKASKFASQELQNIAYDEGELEIQEAAVFALSQLSEDESVPALIEIAKDHPRAEIRKKAIFWLGQSEDERALETIVEIIKQK